jgi:hypothetical protein
MYPVNQRCAVTFLSQSVAPFAVLIFFKTPLSDNACPLLP